MKFIRLFINTSNLGIKSKVRECLLDIKLDPHVYGLCAYRATINRADMVGDPDLLALMENQAAKCWCGPDHHLMAYPIRQGQLYNVVMVTREGASQDRWRESGIPIPYCHQSS